MTSHRRYHSKSSSSPARGSGVSGGYKPVNALDMGSPLRARSIKRTHTVSPSRKRKHTSPASRRSPAIKRAHMSPSRRRNHISPMRGKRAVVEEDDLLTKLSKQLSKTVPRDEIVLQSARTLFHPIDDRSRDSPPEVVVASELGNELRSRLLAAEKRRQQQQQQQATAETSSSSPAPATPTTSTETHNNDE